MNHLEQWILKQMRQRHEDIETACEMSLVDHWKRGVMVDEDFDGNYSVYLSVDVPYGSIHYRRRERISR